MKQIFRLSIFVMLAILITACSSKSEDSEGQYASLDINPSIEFILDENRIVLSVFYVNEDAEVVAADLQLVGLPLSQAIQLYITAAIETGYINVDSNENMIIVTSDDPVVEEEIKDEVEQVYANEKIGVAVFGGEMNEEYVALAATHEISVGLARLISKAIEVDATLTFEAALELTYQELLDILITAHQAKMNAFIATRREEALALKEEMREGVIAKVAQHRLDVEAGLVVAPNYAAIRANVLTNIEAIRLSYQNRMEGLVQDALNRRK